MNTDDLIASLGSELTPVDKGIVARSLVMALGVGLAVTALMFVAFWGVRSDPSAVLGDVPLLAKTVLPLALGCIGVPWVMAQARPAGRSRASRIVWAVPALLAVLVMAAFVTTPPQALPMAVQGKSITTCLWSIPALSMPVLIALLVALRRGAPVSPTRCGAVAGLMAAGFGATIYSLYCVENSPLFFGTWYTLAILAVAACGAVVGGRVLRW